MSCGLVPWASVLCELMTPDPCFLKAVDVQRCLKANRNQEGVCFSTMNAMNRCCTRWNKSSACCRVYEKLLPNAPLSSSVLSES